MKGLYPPFGDPSALPERVLVIAPHPDDEVFGCGGMLAWHARHGARVRVVVLSDGAGGDPDHRAGDRGDESGGGGGLAGQRVQECLASAEVLGLALADFRFLDLPDGELAQVEDLAQRIEQELADFDPGLVYAPSPQELHPDHRAAARAVFAATSGGPERRLFLYGVNVQVTAGILFDTTPVFDTKRAAIRCFESQLAYGDLEAKAAACDAARTVNVEDPAVRFIEGFCDLTTGQLSRYERTLSDLLHQVQGAEPSTIDGLGLPGTTAVISTWNKKDVVRENLESLRAQTLPFAQIVVVDNASTDGTAEMVAADFPEVRLIQMPHSRYGACETFNIGFASASTPLIAILDDDITLPRRLARAGDRAPPGRAAHHRGASRPR